MVQHEQEAEQPTGVESPEIVKTLPFTGEPVLRAPECIPHSSLTAKRPGFSRHRDT